MLELDIGPGVCGEMDDIELELCCSSREASVGLVSLDLDYATLMRGLGDVRIELERLHQRRR